MKRILLATAVASLAVGGYAFAQSAHAPAHHEAAEAPGTEEDDDGPELAAEAKISLADAQAIALHARPGEVKDHELEKEAGGSGLRYSFDILVNGKTFEVGVDAADGAVLENAEEGANPD